MVIRTVNIIKFHLLMPEDLGCRDGVRELVNTGIGAPPWMSGYMDALVSL